MRLRGYFGKNQDSSKVQKMSSKVSITFYNLLITANIFNPLFINHPNPCHPIIVDLPADRCWNDLASLLQLDSKSMNVEQLGVDLIKEQQKINLKFSSNQTAVIPEDRAQVMLAGVSIFLHT